MRENGLRKERKGNGKEGKEGEGRKGREGEGEKERKRMDGNGRKGRGEGMPNINSIGPVK